MKILTVSNLYPPDIIGGYELGCASMVRALREEGHDVEVLTSRPRRPVPRSPGVTRTLRLSERAWRRAEVPASPAVGAVTEVSANFVESANVGALLDALERFAPDVVYLWNLTALGGYGIAGALAHMQTPVVWHLMDDVPRTAVTVGGQPVAAAARLLSQRLRARYLACSQRVVDEITRAGFGFADHVALVPNWVDSMPAPRERRLYPASGRELRIISAGQLAPHKGIDHIIGAAHVLLEHGHSGFTIDIYGAGLTDRYGAMILAHGVSDRVHLRGVLSQHELCELYWDYDVFIFPTWDREPFGFAPMEAAARGCVQLIAENCGNAEWFVAGVECLKVRPHPSTLAASLATILDGRVKLAPIARRAGCAIRESFSVKRAMSAFERAARQAMADPAVRPGRAADAYHLGRFAERLALEWAERV
jgi:glycogen(starch) synthase